MSNVKWENTPSTNTPINEINLNLMNHRPKGGALVFNGNFDLWQRGVTFTISSGYVADRFNVSSLGTPTINRVLNTNNDINSKYNLELVLDNTITTLAQIIENPHNILYDTNSTLSFWVKGSVATTANARIKNNTTATDIQVIQYNITTGWTKVEITFDPSMLWSIDDEIFLSIGQQYGALGTFEYAQVKFEVGETSTEFEPKTLEEVERDCYPYYRDIFHKVTVAAGFRPFDGGASSTTTVICPYDFLGIMREGTKTISFSNLAVVTPSQSTSATVTSVVDNGTHLGFVTGGGLSADTFYNIRTTSASATLTLENEL